MNLNKSQWKEFRFGDLLFDIYKAKATNKDDLTVATDNNNAIRYITRTGENNGCELLADIRDIDTKIIEKGNAITIGDTTATCFYQEEDFITGDHMVVIRADSWLNLYTALYIVAILTNEQYKYSYGRAYLMDRIKDTIIKLPVDDKDNPDWLFMETYIKSLHHKPLTTKNKKETVSELNIKNWKEFKVSDIFEVKYGVNLELNACVECNANDLDAVNFVARTAENNGVSAHVVRIDGVIPQKKGLISVAGGGSVLSTFLQTEPFYSGRDLYTLDSKDNISNAAKMFIITVIEQNKYKYSYGRQANKTLPDLILKLPVDSKGKPDYDFMENYIKSLPYGDRLDG